jgi:phosphatidate phosphatase APP1
MGTLHDKGPGRVINVVIRRSTSSQREQQAKAHTEENNSNTKKELEKQTSGHATDTNKMAEQSKNLTIQFRYNNDKVLFER